MSFGKTADTLMKYAKTRSKLDEFAVPQADRPRFPRDPDDLCFTSVLALSDYCRAFETGNGLEQAARDVAKAASFFDAAARDAYRSDLNDGELILASASYFIIENYGSSLATLNKIEVADYYGGRCERLVKLLSYVLGADNNPPENDLGTFGYLRGEFGDRYNAAGLNATYETWESPEEHFFGRLLVVVTETALNASARELLPISSGLPLKIWAGYLKSDNASRMLWRAQQEIARSGALSGRSVFVRLPTGSGKTRAIELVIRSRILSGSCSQAVVVAPFLALVSEIRRDLVDGLGDIADVFGSSDTLEIDDWVNDETDRPRVMVFTPEKYSFVARHGEAAFDNVTLYVFDECHLISDAHRGPLFELVISELLLTRRETQIVMLSAVATNPTDIAVWAMRDSSAVVSDAGIPTTEKSVGIVYSRMRHISYRELDNVGEEAFFVPLRVKQQTLDKKPRERTERVFPSLDRKPGDATRDWAIYLTDRLVINGGVAIYLQKATSIGPFFRRLSDLKERGCRLDGLANSYKTSEIEKFQTLFSLHYGPDNLFASGLDYGALPHYSNLAGCIRRCVETAIQRRDASCVACTPTLSQGVNLPIKYLMITGTHSTAEAMSTRDFKNLIGRAVRSGKYSEGSILVVDARAEKPNVMAEYTRLLGEGDGEPCESAILSLMRDVVLTDGRVFSGSNILDVIVKNLGNPDLETGLIDAFLHAGLAEGEAREIVRTRLSSLSAIETYIARELFAEEDEVDVSALCGSTYAFASAGASEATKAGLMTLFESVRRNLEDPTRRAWLATYAKTQLGVRETDAIRKWCQSVESTPFAETPTDMEGIECLCKAFYDISNHEKQWLEDLQFARLVMLWLEGKSSEEITQYLKGAGIMAGSHKPSILHVDRTAKQTVSFGLSNFVSCIIDIVESDESLGEKFDAADLALLHRRLKYGVENRFECIFCEEVVDDRMIAKGISALLGVADCTDGRMMRTILTMYEGSVSSYLSDYPRFCIERFHEFAGR